MPIVWTEEARKRLPPRTREQAAPFKRGDAGAIWLGIRKNFAPRGKYDPIETAFVKGQSQTSPDMAALMEKCRAIASRDEPPALDDLDVAAAFSAMLERIHYQRGLPLLLATLPVPRAFEVHLRSRDFAAAPNWMNMNNPLRLGLAGPDAAAVDREWRELLLAQPDDVRAECKEIARAAIGRAANLGQRLTIANAFFEETAWGDDVCRDWLARGVSTHVLLNVVVQDFEHARRLLAVDTGWAHLPSLVDRFGERVLPMLCEMAKKPGNRYRASAVAQALALFDEPAAAEAMLHMMGLVATRPAALSYFSRFPQHVEAALAAAETLKGRAGKIAREVLAGAQRAATSAVPAEDEAKIEELPRVLARPPWLDEKKPKKPPTKLALERLDLPESVTWGPDERERALKLFPRPAKPASEETLADYAKMRQDGKFVDFVKHKNEVLPDEVVLEAWNAGQKTYIGALGNKLRYALACFGDAAYPGLAFFVDHLASGWGDAPFLLNVKSWRLALPLARQLESRRHGKLAWQWLERNAELAILALVPHAFGAEKSERAAAERALFRLKASGVDVIAIGARYGEPARAALEKLFGWDPLYDLPKTMPKLGPAFRPETLSRPRLVEGGKALPLAALETIASMLTISPLDPPYPGLLEVKRACEPRSLAELSWELARAWEHTGHKKKEAWMLMSLAHFADDEVVRRLTPGMRPDFAVTVLEAIGSDAALMEMATIAGRSQSQGAEWTLGGRIEKLLAQAAAERGITKDELEEDLAPTAELDDAGTLILDYGSRKVEVGFDECLVPFVRSESGGRARGLPPARKDDDPAKVERAKSIWRDLKEDVTVIAARRIRALERAMTGGRTWTFDRFRRAWLEHRLMRHLARGVLWKEICEDGATTVFRVAEDGTLSDADDAPLELAANAKIGVAHPLHMTKEAVEKWRTVLDDYEIAQPFAQLGRQYVTIETDASRLPWPYGDVAAGDLVTRLLVRGYVRGPYLQGKQSFRRDLLRGGQLRVEFKSVGRQVQEMALVFLDGDQEVPISRLDTIEVADAIYELQA